MGSPCRRDRTIRWRGWRSIDWDLDGHRRGLRPKQLTFVQRFRHRVPPRGRGWSPQPAEGVGIHQLVRELRAGPPRIDGGVC